VKRIAQALLPILLSPAGCSVVLSPGEQQCQADKDCAARGFPDSAVCSSGVCVTDVWECLGHVVEPVPDPTKKVSFTVALTFTDKTPVTMATVDVCSKLDINCTGTDPSYPKGLTPGPDGSVNLTVVQGFDGFVRVSGPKVMDSRVFVGRPIITPPNVKSVLLLEPSEYSILAASVAMQAADPTRGSAILLSVDCSDNSGAGVSFSCPAADSATKAFYLINQLPAPTASATDVDGFGGFFNLPVGTTVVTATLKSNGAYIGESSFQVLANTISYVQISPTPM
jgi:hypothetical protein